MSDITKSTPTDTWEIMQSMLGPLGIDVKNPRLAAYVEQILAGLDDAKAIGDRSANFWRDRYKELAIEVIKFAGYEGDFQNHGLEDAWAALKAKRSSHEALKEALQGLLEFETFTTERVRLQYAGIPGTPLEKACDKAQKALALANGGQQ